MDVARAKLAGGPAAAPTGKAETAVAKPAAPDRRPPAPDPLRGALLDSRQRWRDLVTLAADIAFETDIGGRFVFVAPEQPLGWVAEHLVGQPADLLLAESGGTAFNPFAQQPATRSRRAWLRRPDGGFACLAFSVMPLPGAQGMRGVGQDVTEQDGQDLSIAAALRRGEVLDHILFSMRQEVLAPRMMQAVLTALAGASGAAGACVMDLPTDRDPEDDLPAVSYRTAHESGAVLYAASEILERGEPDGGQATAPDGCPVMACPCRTRFGEAAGLVLWRLPGTRPWDTDDLAVLASAAGLVRVVLEHQSIQHEMARQARTDPLTGLLNRRAFIEEVQRRTDRLDREGVPGTLMFIDLDNFKQLNDGSGHDVGDEALCLVAGLLRTAVRPSDLVARLGGDEFALWLDGADELAAAERAEHLRIDGPELLAHLGLPLGLVLSMSIGIATRWPGRGEDIDTLIHRADQVMYEVKRGGRGHWRVSRSDSW